jgi:murein L,D-transpeptidase YafK
MTRLQIDRQADAKGQAARSQPSRGRRFRLLASVFVAALAAGMLAGCASSEPTTPKLTRAEKVVVKKSERKMQLIQGGKVVREYRIALGNQPRGHKMRQGDERTPQGDYILDWRNPYSSFYKSIHVSYPNSLDLGLARFVGDDPGGMIMIHGQPNHVRSAKVKAEYKRRDWTDGCIAVQNHEMDEIWRTVRDGTPIQILP